MRKHPHHSDRDDRLTEQNPIDIWLAHSSSESDQTASPGDASTSASTSFEAPAPAQAELAELAELNAFLINLLREVGTGVWRLRQRMVEPESGQARDELRRVYRQLENLWEMLEQAGLRIHDHTGEQVPEYGASALKIIAYEPAPGATQGFVVETVKPTIYFRDQIIQIGEAIVGSPPKPG